MVKVRRGFQNVANREDRENRPVRPAPPLVLRRVADLPSAPIAAVVAPQVGHDLRATHRSGEAWRAHQLHQRFADSTSRLLNGNNFDVLSGGDDHITSRDLQNVVDGSVAASDDLKREAAFLLESPSFFNALDVGADVGEVDDKISREDIEGVTEALSQRSWSDDTIGVEGAIDTAEEARIVLDKYKLLSDAAAGSGAQNGHYSNEDVRALLADPNIPEDLRAAAQFIETGHVELPGDGSSLFGTLASPFTGAAGWIANGAGDAAGAVGDTARDHLLGPASLDSNERTELLDAAHAAQTSDGDRDLPFNEQKNAHYSNTPEQMREALEGDYDWLEGDVRRDPPVMGHDWYGSGGLTIDDWLQIGGESGRGLKLDIKEAESIDGVIAAVQNADVPEERLMFNVDALAGPGGSGQNASPEDVQRLREAFPNAHIAIGAKTGATSDGTTYTEAQVAEMIALADSVGGSVFFPLRAELVTPQIVERLEEHGRVSIWNSTHTYDVGGPDALAADAQRFRDMGVTGIIDLR